MCVEGDLPLVSFLPHQQIALLDIRFQQNNEPHAQGASSSFKQHHNHPFHKQNSSSFLDWVRTSNMTVLRMRAQHEGPPSWSSPVLDPYILHIIDFCVVGPLYIRSQGQCSTQIKHSYWCKSWISPKGVTLGVKAEIEKIFSICPKLLINGELYGLVLALGFKKNLGNQFATLGAKQQAKNAKSWPQVFSALTCSVKRALFKQFYKCFPEWDRQPFTGFIFDVNFPYKSRINEGAWNMNWW